MEISEKAIYKEDYVVLRFNNGVEVINLSNYEILGNVDYVPAMAPEIVASESGKSYSIAKAQQEYFSFNLKYYDHNTRVKWEKIRKHIADGYTLQAELNWLTVPQNAWPLEDNTTNVSDEHVNVQAVFENAVIELPPDFAIDKMGRAQGAVIVDEIPIKIYNSSVLPLPVNSCALISISDFNITWNVNGSNELTSISFSLPGSSDTIIDTIDSFPNGSLLDPGGTPVRTMVYDPGLYAPTSSITLTPGTWTLQINDINITTDLGDECVYDLTSTYFVVDTNQAPTLSSLAITGDFDNEGTLVASYIYADNEGDLQDVPGTVEGFYTYTDSGGTVGETLVITGKQWEPSLSHVGKYVKFKSTPAAQTGTTPGLTYESAVYGPIVQIQEFSFTTNFDPATDGFFDPVVAYTGGGTVKWEFADTSELTGNSIATTGNGLDGTTQTVKLKVQDLGAITSIDFDNDKINGTFNVANLTGLNILKLRDNNITSLEGFVGSQNFNGDFLISRNPSLTISGLTNPTFTNCNFQSEATAITALAYKSGSSFTQILSKDCASLTTANLTGCSFSGSDSNRIDFNGCTSLGTLTLPPSGGGVIGRVWANNSAITAISFAGIQVSYEIQLRSISTLTTISSYGAQTQKIYQILADNCTSLTGVQDMSSFSYLPDYILFSGSPVTEISLPGVSGSSMLYGIIANGSNLSLINNLSSCTNITESNSFVIDIRNNSMSETEINTVLADLESVASLGYTGRAFKGEGTNAAPTAGPPDGATAASRLAAVYGFTVTTT